MITTQRLAEPGKAAILGLAVVSFTVWTWASYARWANFDYRTFDLAYYTQSLWQLIHGRFQVPVLGVPLMGNHVEPIVFLIGPLFLVVRHPMLLVVIQNAALASMGPVAFSLGLRLGLRRGTALFLAGAMLITPATGYVALHEFHPEALTALFLLLMLEARLRGSLRMHWVWLIAALACKENIALLVAAYCGVHALLERKRPLSVLFSWYLWPMSLSVLWFLLCTKLITPALNSGGIDYLALYNRLGTSAGDILQNAITHPQRIIGELFQSLSHGNLVWALLLPFLAVPLLRLRWLLIAAPIFLQHLLSWRSSEWTIYFHYAAPILPLFWMAMAEGIVRIDRWVPVPAVIRRFFPCLVLVACVAAQIFLGPAGDIAAAIANWSSGQHSRDRKQAFVHQIPLDASVLAPLPYLSHLAMREKLYSLHYVLKGLKTLSRSTYSPPPPTDFVLIDYDDSATFDGIAGYYHPVMKTVDGRVIPSSDRLLHEFLQRCAWTAFASDELVLLRQVKSTEEFPSSISSPGEIIDIVPGTTLTGIAKLDDELAEQGLAIEMSWDFHEPREIFPWMFLRLTPSDHRNAIVLSRGLCAPEAGNGPYQERWHITSSGTIPEGDYRVDALFVDNTVRVWTAKSSQPDVHPRLLSPPVSLGELKVAAGKSKPSGN